MALLFIITVLSLTGTLVDSASNITSCDAPQDNATCTQGACLHPPCTMRCGLTTAYQQCLQTCNSSCDSIKCDASDRCNQNCKDGKCTSMTCDAKSCFQRCESGICGVMTCAKSAKSATTCEQTSLTGQMICEHATCQQNCNGGNCSMICSSNVNQCTQSCMNGGNCQYKCEAAKCNLNCNGGNCTKIVPPTAEMPSTTTKMPLATTKMPPATTSSGDRLQLRASVGLILMFAVVAFM